MYAVGGHLPAGFEDLLRNPEMPNGIWPDEYLESLHVLRDLGASAGDRSGAKLRADSLKRLGHRGQDVRPRAYARVEKSDPVVSHGEGLGKAIIEHLVDQADLRRDNLYRGVIH